MPSVALAKEGSTRMMTLWPRHEPCLVIGHRGAMGYAPENTIVSFEEGIRRGADWIEMDVQLANDGEVVVIHDLSVERTTNGSGFVREMPWRKLRTLDAGSWFQPEFTGERIPILDEVFDRFRNRRTSRGRPVGFVVELKTFPGFADDLARATVRVVSASKVEDRAVVISFDANALGAVKRSRESLPTGLLYSDTEEDKALEKARSLEVGALFPRKTAVTHAGVVAAHAAGLVVATWTANTRMEMRRMLHCGVDAITTNFPDKLRALLP